MAREDFARFQRSCQPRIFEAHYRQHPGYNGSGFSSIDHLVRSGKAPGFESEIDSRERKGSDRPSGQGGVRTASKSSGCRPRR
jgi:hypothetical protein